MQGTIIEYVFLILIIVGLVMLSNKIRIVYPIVLLVGGVLLSFGDFFSNLSIEPDLIFFIFLPPLLYEAAWQISWKEFWKWRRVIMSFAFPIVIITSCVVAFSSSALIPGFTLALGFLLGGIVSPPDAISATTIMRQVKAPRILVSVAEGESLLNDASALIVYRFALAAVITGEFHFGEAVGSFLLVIVMGTLIGVGIALVFYAIYRWLPTTPSIEIVLSFLAPYCMYYFAERFHFSGVLAVVGGGLLLSSQRHVIMSYQGRVQGSNVWATIGFVLNGLVFLLIGLQLPHITSKLEEVSLGQAVWYGVVMSLVLIVARVVCALGASVFTRIMGHFITVADRNPGWRVPMAFGWSGMRGVVSLAAALAIPVVANGQPFPYRNLILVITFVIIFVTLVFQGLTLPWLMEKLHVRDADHDKHEQEQEFKIRKVMSTASLEFLNQMNGSGNPKNEHLRNLMAKMTTEVKVFQQEFEMFNNESRQSLSEFEQTYLQALDRQRKALHKLNGKQEYDEELIRKYLSLLDLEETKLREMAVSLRN